jgi:uncharacterized protein with FMN-binding domain
MKLFLKVIVTVVIIFALIIGGFGFYMTRNLSSVKNLPVSHIDISQLKDGIYTGKYDAGRFSNEVKVSIKDNKITKIDVTKKEAFANEDVTQKLLKEVIKKQNTDVDTISGATVTSKAYLKSIENAISK